MEEGKETKTSTEVLCPAVLWHGHTGKSPGSVSSGPWESYTKGELLQLLTGLPTVDVPFPWKVPSMDAGISLTACSKGRESPTNLPGEEGHSEGKHNAGC